MEEKLITIPNIITLGRLIAIPFFILALVRNQIEIAVMLFGAIALSDAFDGLSARIMKQKTKIGAFFDSTTDFMAIGATLITFFIMKKYIQPNLIIALAIPAIIGGIAKLVYTKKKKSTSPTVIGKVTYAFAYLTVVALLINFKYKNIFLITLTILTYAMVANYIVKDVKLYIKK